MESSAAERLAERLARLQAVTSKLAAAGDPGDIAVAVCDHGAAGLGASAAVMVQLSGDAFELLRQNGYDEGSVDAFRRFAVDASTPFGEAIRTRALVVINSREERDERYPVLEEHPMRYATSVVAPLVVDDGVLGAIGFSFLRSRTLDDDDRRFVMALAGQAAQAFARARAVDAERAAARRQQLLARTTGVLASSLDADATLAAVGRLCTPELCDFLVLTVGDEGHISVAVHSDPEAEQVLQEFVLGPGIALAATLVQVVAGGRIVSIPKVAPRWWSIGVGDEAGAVLDELDISSVLAVGLATGAGQLGALCLVRSPDRPPFDEDDTVLASELGSRIGFALDNARLHQAQAEVARTLQASLLPPRLPEIPGVRLASRYAPVGDGSIVGGDFYDVFPLGADRWGIVLGDVCGQGVAAASLTAQVRYTIRAAARLWRSPAEVLRFTNAALLDDDLGERFCTALAGVVEVRPHGVAVTLASAGHHLPLHVPAGRTPVLVGQLGSALGLLRDPDLADTTVALGAGDLLVLYTDGVVEARRPDGTIVDEGFLDELVAASSTGGAEAVAAAVERAVIDVGEGRTHDDVALLVLEAGADVPDVPEHEAPATGPLERRFDADVQHVGAVRRDVGTWLAAQGIDPATTTDIVLAVAELVTNAVEAARTAVELRAWAVPEGIVVEVTDDGPGFEGAPRRPLRQLDPLAERGRGLFLVHALVDDCTIESGPNGSIVRCFVAR